MSVKFNGINSRATLPLRATPPANSFCSFYTVFRTGAVVPNTVMYINAIGRISGWPGSLRLYSDATGRLCMGTEQGTAKSIATDLVLEPLTEYRVLITYDGAMNMYVNSPDPFSYLNAILTAGGDPLLVIGGQYTQALPGWRYFFNGEILDVYFWNSFLSEGDIGRLFTTGPASTLVPYTDGWTLLSDGSSANGGSALNNANNITYNPGIINSVNSGTAIYAGGTFPVSVTSFTPTSGSIDGVALTTASATQIQLPPLTDSAQTPFLGNRTLLLSDGTNSVMKVVSVVPPPGLNYARLDQGFNNGEANSPVYGFAPPAEEGDILLFPSSDVFIDDDANTRVEDDGELTLWHLDKTDKVARSFSLTTGEGTTPSLITDLSELPIVINGGTLSFSVPETGTVTALTIDGVPLTNVSNNNGVITATKPNLAAGAIIPLFGERELSITVGGVTHTLPVPVVPSNDKAYYQPTSYDLDSEGSVTAFIDSEVGDQFVLSTAASLGVMVNRIAVVGGYLQSDNPAEQVLYHVDSDTREVTRLNITLPGTAPEEDVTPFDFATQTNAPFEYQQYSNVITIAGIAAGSLPVTVQNGMVYRLNDGSGWTQFTDAPGTVQNGTYLQVMIVTPSIENATVTRSVTVGTYTTTFTVVTGAADITPQPFAITSVTSAIENTVYESAEITISGVSDNFDVPLTVEGMEYRIRRSGVLGDWDDVPTAVRNFDTVQFSITSSETSGQSVVGSVTVGTYTTTWTVTNGLDTVADLLDIDASLNQPINTLIESETLTVTGVSVGATVVATTSNCQLSVYNGSTWGSWVSTANLTLNSVFKLRSTTSTQYETTTNATVTLNGVPNVWAITTQIDEIPNPFVFNSVPNATPSTTYESNVVTVSGIGSGALIPLVPNDLEVSVNNGEGFGDWENTTQMVVLGTEFKVRLVAPDFYGSSVSGSVTLGGVVTRIFTVSTGSPPDLTPDPVVFYPTPNAPLGSAVISNPVVVLGVSAGVAVNISVNLCEYSVYDGSSWSAWTTAPGSVYLGQRIQLRVDTNNTLGAVVNAEVTIGTSSFNWVVTNTEVIDITPDNVVLNAIVNGIGGETVTSNSVTLTGIDPEETIPFVVSNGTVSKNGGSFVTNGTAEIGDTFVLSTIVPTQPGANKRVKMIIGGGQWFWNVKNGELLPETDETALTNNFEAKQPFSASPTAAAPAVKVRTY